MPCRADRHFDAIGTLQSRNRMVNWEWPSAAAGRSTAEIELLVFVFVVV
jgi:hypothetical protein